MIMPISKDRLEFDINKSKTRILRKIHTILRYQFETPIFEKILNPDSTQIEFSRNTGNMKYIYHNSERIFSYKPTTGTFTLSISGAILLHSNSKPPNHRVVVLSEVQDFIRQGKSVFCKHVIQIHENLRIGSEVLVVTELDELLAVGKLSVPPSYAGLSVGMAVAVRKGIPKIDKSTKTI
jgi:uncharacterized protein with predicted RNA binding PUA domain